MKIHSRIACSKAEPKNAVSHAIWIQSCPNLLFFDRPIRTSRAESKSALRAYRDHPEEPALPAPACRGSLPKGTAESQTCPNGWWEPPHLCGGKSALALCERVSTLITRFPGFPVQLGGSGALLAAFLNESRIRGRVQRSVQEIRV
jgi:hypothetical protein